MADVAGGDRSGRWLVDPGFGVYVHIPFCLHRCHYCDFNTYEGQDDLYGPYIDALVTDIERWDAETRPATSVFFGGGTPTLLPPRALGRILGAIRARIGLEPDAEITVEANPETVDEGVFGELLKEGFNRVSIGVQSLAPHVLRGLGRTHGPETALSAVAAARRAGVADLSVDLIYGSPWERPEDWVTSLEGVVAADPDHVSAYALTVETGTPLHTLIGSGRVPDVDPDVQADRHDVASRYLGDAGFARYEVSNWARPGRASRHNVLYWSSGDYLGFGAGAHAHIGGRRWWNHRLPRDLISAVTEARPRESGHEVVADRSAEALMLGLRLVSGVHEAGFVRRFGTDGLDARSAILQELEARGQVERTGGYLRVADSSSLLTNDVVCRLL
ncbi:MAG: radical SAM family heme chaperone HemW [Actinomycetota bacterium]|nr:radical SAM family heme chaperone HemW [Actinomycetota bacterium]